MNKVIYKNNTTFSTKKIEDINMIIDMQPKFFNDFRGRIISDVPFKNFRIPENCKFSNYTQEKLKDMALELPKILVAKVINRIENILNLNWENSMFIIVEYERYWRTDVNIRKIIENNTSNFIYVEKKQSSIHLSWDIKTSHCSQIQQKNIMKVTKVLASSKTSNVPINFMWINSSDCVLKSVKRVYDFWCTPEVFVWTTLDLLGKGVFNENMIKTIIEKYNNVFKGKYFPLTFEWQEENKESLIDYL